MLGVVGFLFVYELICSIVDNIFIFVVGYVFFFDECYYCYSCVFGFVFFVVSVVLGVKGCFNGYELFIVF